MGGFDIEILFKVGSMVVLMLQGIFMWLVWSLRQEFVRRSDYEKIMAGLGKRVNETQNRLQSVEFQLESLPKASALHEILLALEEMRGEQKALSERIVAQHEILRRLEHPLDFLTQQHIRGLGS